VGVPAGTKTPRALLGAKAKAGGRRRKKLAFATPKKKGLIERQKQESLLEPRHLQEGGKRR